MKITLYAAVSVDGFIAQTNGDTDWVKDDELFEKVCKDFGCVAMGRNTYEEYGKPPFEGVQHLVLTEKAGMDIRHSNVTYVSGAEKTLEKAKDLGFDKLLVIGGSQCNASFAKAGLLDEIWIDSHPLILGEGKKLLGDFTDSLDLGLISSEPQPQGFVHSKFKIKK
jgi:dihydrofolate reductase